MARSSSIVHLVADASHVEDVRGLLALTVQEAKLAGLDRAQFHKLVDDTVAMYYSKTGLRVGFIECNRIDAATLSRDLQLALARPVDPLLLSSLTSDPQAYSSAYDVLAVNLTHLIEVERAIGKDARVAVVGLIIPPIATNLMEIARLTPGTRLAIVCDLEPTMENLRGLVSGYNPSLVVTTCLTSELERDPTSDRFGRRHRGDRLGEECRRIPEAARIHSSSSASRSTTSP